MLSLVKESLEGERYFVLSFLQDSNVTFERLLAGFQYVVYLSHRAVKLELQLTFISLFQ